MIILKEYDHRADMVAAITQDTYCVLDEALFNWGTASWAVSGGSTPKPMFKAISAMQLDWGNVSVALVDERWVDEDHSRSNTGFIKKWLLQENAAAAKLIPMKTADKLPETALDAVNETYGRIAPFDVVLLGLGPDGHTASLFPEAEGLEDAFRFEDTCIAIKAKMSVVTGEELDRMTLTAHAIGAAGHVVMMIMGAEKKAVLKRAMLPGSDLPIARVHRSMTRPLTVYWAP